MDLSKLVSIRQNLEYDREMRLRIDSNKISLSAANFGDSEFEAPGRIRRQRR